jgi:hypothetical protein
MFVCFNFPRCQQLDYVQWQMDAILKEFRTKRSLPKPGIWFRVLWKRAQPLSRYGFEAGLPPKTNPKLSAGTRDTQSMCVWHARFCMVHAWLYLGTGPFHVSTHVTTAASDNQDASICRQLTTLSAWEFDHGVRRLLHGNYSTTNCVLLGALRCAAIWQMFTKRPHEPSASIFKVKWCWQGGRLHKVLRAAPTRRQYSS